MDSTESPFPEMADLSLLTAVATLLFTRPIPIGFQSQSRDIYLSRGFWKKIVTAFNFPINPKIFSITISTNGAMSAREAIF
jgi:hypothetical protein